MATPLLGKEMVVIYDSSVVGYATDFSFSGDKGTIEITTLASNGWKEFMAGDKSWTVDFNGMVSKTAALDSSRGFDYIFSNFITSDASVVVAIKPSITGNKYLSGGGLLTGVKMQGGVNDKVTFSGSIQGTGPLSQLTA